MPSRSLKIWQTTTAKALDEVEAAHTLLGGSERGRRYATMQINHAYVMLLSSHFQAFCRGLHTESVDFLVVETSTNIRQLFQDALVRQRKLDHGNPNPGNIGADFGRLGINLWPELLNKDRRNTNRREHLEDLNVWRNAIAHQNFSSSRLGGRKSIRLHEVKQWRSSCNVLATHMDDLLARHLTELVGTLR